MKQYFETDTVTEIIALGFNVFILHLITFYGVFRLPYNYMYVLVHRQHILTVSRVSVGSFSILVLWALKKLYFEEVLSVSNAMWLLICEDEINIFIMRVFF